MTNNKVVKKLADYTAPAWHIDRTELQFDIFEDHVVVHGTLSLRSVSGAAGPIELNGEHLELLDLSINGESVDAARWKASDTMLTVEKVPAECNLQTVVKIDPWNNTWLEGLYKSGDVLCTQNESEGFRKITYYLDRPDVMSVFTTIIRADKRCFPQLLANGNMMEQKNLPEGRQEVVWHDPFKKPAYLFALVAGDLAMVEDNYETLNGRNITLRIYVDHGNEGRCAHALESLKKSMLWDEQKFGREYDLDLFMIVAVDAFNYGAMENKGLNIFNSSCVLADPETATDYDFDRIESIVAHEYFHNWTGDRVTLRDWFQITLKEGLTVYRDQEFSSDMHSRPVQRIDDARTLREAQFSEDAGPNAHPIQTDTYIEVSNFYTATVYNKGAEVIRMVETMVGKEKFRTAMDLYFERHDGQAITTEDFLKAMEDGAGIDLSLFRRWYRQAGTPTCTVAMDYDEKAKTCTLNVKQACAPTADGSPKEPQPMPMVTGLIGPDGQDLPLHMAGDANAPTQRILNLTAAEQEFVFTDVPEKPLPSVFRNFSAPVYANVDYTREDLAFLLANDSDAFNRYDAGQKLATVCLIEMAEDASVPCDQQAIAAFSAILKDETLDPAFCTKALTLPSLGSLSLLQDVCNFDGAHRAREKFLTSLATANKALLRKKYAALKQNAYSIATADMAQRGYRNLCLSLLARLPGGAVAEAYAQFEASNNMTDTMAALAILCRGEASPEREKALEAFRNKWADNFIVMNKWFAVQAAADRPDAFEAVQKLAIDPLFDAKNPNRIRSVYGALFSNMTELHHASGRGYELLADQIIAYDAFNEHLSSGYAKIFKHYAKLDPARKALAKTQLERILAQDNVSGGLYEIANNTLK